MRIAIPAALLALALPACSDDACAAYTDYMCDCHANDTSVASCDELETIYSEADASLQEECTVALQDQEEQDEEEGYVCGSSGDTGT